MIEALKVARTAIGLLRSCELAGEQGADDPVVLEALARTEAVLTDGTEMADPRELGGDIAGPGGPFDFGEFVIDASKALIVDYQDVAKIDPEQGARGVDDAFAFLFAGRINQTTDRAKVMLLGNLDFMAALTTQIYGVAERAGMARQLDTLCQARWSEMPHPQTPK